MQTQPLTTEKPTQEGWYFVILPGPLCITDCRELTRDLAGPFWRGDDDDDSPPDDDPEGTLYSGPFWPPRLPSPSILSHPMWDETDYHELTEKGYSDEEIIGFWDRDSD